MILVILDELSSSLPPHAAHAVSASIQEWANLVTSPLAASSDLSAQCELWLVLLSGQKTAVSFLEPENYLDAAERTGRKLRRSAIAVLAGAIPSVVATICLFATGVLILLLAPNRPGTISAGLAGILAAATLAWKGVGGNVGSVADRIEAPLWDFELDLAIARAITLLASAETEDGRAKIESAARQRPRVARQHAEGRRRRRRRRQASIAAPALAVAAKRTRLFSLVGPVAVALLRLTTLALLKRATVGGRVRGDLDGSDLEHSFPTQWPTGSVRAAEARASDETLERATAWGAMLAKADGTTQAQLARRGVVTVYGFARIRGCVRLAVIRYLPTRVRPTRRIVAPVVVGDQPFPVVLRPWIASGSGPRRAGRGSCLVAFETLEGRRQGVLTAAHTLKPEDCSPGDAVEIDTRRGDPAGRLHVLSQVMDLAVVDTGAIPPHAEGSFVPPTLGYKDVRLLTSRGPIDTKIVAINNFGGTIPGEPGKEPISPALFLLGKKLIRGDSGCLGLDLEPTLEGRPPRPYLIYLGRTNLGWLGDDGYAVSLEQARRVWSLTVLPEKNTADERAHHD